MGRSDEFDEFILQNFASGRENICYNINSECPIDLALTWRHTKQGHEYWRKINDLVINELSK